MPFSATPTTLIVYSNPEHLSRLRLDREHKAIEELLKKYQLPSWVVQRIHAANLFDVGSALRERDYEVILLSCHGDDNGLYLEGPESGTPVEWPLVATTVEEAAPNTSALILNACHSDAAADVLSPSCPFLITMRGEASDDAAITFSQLFLDGFYATEAIGLAFRRAVVGLEQMGLGDTIEPVLRRRERSGNSVFQATFSRRRDSIFIDLSDAEEDIAHLSVSRHAFLSLLTRKIRIHSWIFKAPRERVVLQIGQFFGVFSWRNSRDVVTCHEVLRLRSGLDVEECLGWTRLMVVYNDLRSERYRTVPRPAAEENKGLLANSIDAIETCLTHTLRGDDIAPVAERLASAQFSVSVATVGAQVDQAKRCFDRGDLNGVVVALETAISAVHDLVDELTSTVTVRGGETSDV